MKNTAMLRLALLQIAPGNTLQENLEKGERACRAAKVRGATWLFFPKCGATDTG